MRTRLGVAVARWLYRTARLRHVVAAALVAGALVAVGAAGVRERWSTGEWLVTVVPLAVLAWCSAHREFRDQPGRDDEGMAGLVTAALPASTPGELLRPPRRRQVFDLLQWDHRLISARDAAAVGAAMRAVGVPPGLTAAEVLVEFPPRRVLLAAAAGLGVVELRAGLPDDEALRALLAARSHPGP